MTGIGKFSAYQQANQINKGSKCVTKTIPSKPAPGNSQGESKTSKVETKGFTPIDTSSSLVPKVTEYGYTIGDVKLSDEAKDYYEQLKAKYNNMEFIAVSKDMKAQVKANAAAYGNAKKMVVLIDEEKLERMATDESFRKKYEGIIAMSSAKIEEAKNSLASSGVNVKNFGISVDENGKESFFATVEKSLDLQKKRIEKKAEEKKEQKAREHKKAEKEARKERLEKLKKEKTEKAEKLKKAESDDDDIISDEENDIDGIAAENGEREYVIIEAGSFDELISKVQSYSYDDAASRVMTPSERMIGGHVDFRG